MKLMWIRKDRYRENVFNLRKIIFRPLEIIMKILIIIIIRNRKKSFQV